MPRPTELLAIAVAFMIAASMAHGAHAQQRTLAVVGDSLSVGLAGALHARSPGAPIVNYGVVSSGLARPNPVDWQRRIREITATTPTFMMVMVGMNDTSDSPDMAYIRSAISFMEPIRRAGIPFAVVAVPHTRDSARNLNIDQVNKVLAAVSARMGGKFLPLAPFPPDERTRDGIHFTTAGYQDLAGRVVSELMPLR